MLFLILISSFFGCEKDPQIITKTVVETDTLIVTQHDTVVVQLTDTLTLTEFIQDTATTFILVRHGETSGAGSDPVLSTDGQLRADELLRVLKNVPLNAVFATNFIRTQSTALPTATDHGLTVETYGATNLNPLVDGVLENQHGGTVLVVGHSNTTPNLLNLLTGTNDFTQLPESQYDNLYVVSVAEKGRATVTHLKYGVPTP